MGLLIDWFIKVTGTRAKYDNLAIRDNGALSTCMSRLRCGIEHSRMSRVPHIGRYIDATDCTTRSIGLCKHLCGCATDFALRCVCTPSPDGRPMFDGLALIPCCHHRLPFAEYAGDLGEILDVDDEWWPVFRHISTWAVCGFKKSTLVDKKPHCDNMMECPVCVLSDEDKEAVGR